MFACVCMCILHLISSKLSFLMPVHLRTLAFTFTLCHFPVAFSYFVDTLFHCHCINMTLTFNTLILHFHLICVCFASNLHVIGISFALRLHFICITSYYLALLAFHQLKLISHAHYMCTLLHVHLHLCIAFTPRLHRVYVTFT